MPYSERTVNDAEVHRFSQLAWRWWDPHGPLRALHQMNPVRLAVIRQMVGDHFGYLPADKPLVGLSAVDIGCGGGILSEPLARLGACVTGVDAAGDAVHVARKHAEARGLEIDYRVCAAEEVVKSAPGSFDIVLAMEVVEHVADLGAFFSACRHLMKSSGLFIFSTINRTIWSYLGAIVGAEHVLRLLPVGTHSWRQFVTPEEARTLCRRLGLRMRQPVGLVYRPFSASAWRVSTDVSVNYVASAHLGS